MSDYGRINGAELDRHITGNYGEDQFKNGPGDCQDECDEIDECPYLWHKADCEAARKEGSNDE
jgi:hypothetical protein